MNFKSLTAAAFMAACISLPVSAGMITPGIIWGEGNTNQGFTVETFADVELGLRAKLRYPTPSDQLGTGIVQDADGNYIFDTTGKAVPSDRSIFNFDWSINTKGDALDLFTFVLGVDYDPTFGVDLFEYDPVSVAYLGDSDSWINTDGGKSPIPQTVVDTTTDLSLFSVAQNSVNMGFLPGAPLGAGAYQISLSAFDRNGDSLGATTINVIVDSVPVSAPATSILLSAAFGGLVILRRKARKLAQ